MHQKKWIVVGSACGLLAFLAGCDTTDDSAGLSPTDETHLAANESAAGNGAGGAVSPIESYKQKVTREAMEGLIYEPGGVLVDEAFARRLGGVGDASAAEASYEKGLDEISNHNNFLGAIRAMTNAVIRMPDQPKYYIGLARALEYKGAIDAAESALRTALELDPNSIEARFMFASRMYGTGRYDDAIEQWNLVLDLDPEHEVAHGRLALAYYYAGDYAASWQHVHAAERLGYELPPQFRPLLAQQLNEPAK